MSFTLKERKNYCNFLTFLNSKKIVMLSGKNLTWTTKIRWNKLSKLDFKDVIFYLENCSNFTEIHQITFFKCPLKSHNPNSSKPIRSKPNRSKIILKNWWVEGSARDTNKPYKYFYPWEIFAVFQSNYHFPQIWKVLM